MAIDATDVLRITDAMLEDCKGARVMVRYEQSRDDLEAENAKLRDFANRLWVLLSRNEPCFVWKGMVEEARDLGIEVDDE